MKLTRREIEHIKFGLRIAINSEYALYRAHDSVSDKDGGKEVRANIKKNIRNWKVIEKKLEDEAGKENEREGD